ncbi:MAG: type II toxin-antitoxin system ParD family antitoxin [Rhodospirillaceae bacterium]|nr:type II toxin-antitoxin system ParD family antitoxin [Rhodospirillaceae bacterium]
MTVKSSISLTDEQHAFARALVEAGRYASVSAVLQQGVDMLRQRMDAEEAETAALRALLSRRRHGEFVGAEEMDARLNTMIADKRRAHGLPS